MHDVIVLDDGPEGVQYLQRLWASERVRVFHTDDPDVLLDPLCLRRARPPAWGGAPHARRLSAVLIDLDLDGGAGPTGGMRGVLAASRSPELIGVPVILRTQHLRKERDLAAVLAAELCGRPLPWWNRNKGADMDLIQYVIAAAETPLAQPESFGATLVRPIVIDGRNARNARQRWPLGRTLFSLYRWKIWMRVKRLGTDAAVYGWEDDSLDATWSDMQRSVSALAYLLQSGHPLYSLPATSEWSSLEEGGSIVIDVEATERILLALSSGGRRSLPRLEHLGATYGAYLDILCSEEAVRTFLTADLFALNGTAHLTPWWPLDATPRGTG